METETSPEDVARQVDHDIGDARDFCAALLEEVNDHAVSHSLAAANVGDFDLACEFMNLAKDVEEAGELTADLRAKRDELLDRLEEAEGELENEPESEDEGE